MLGVLDVNFCSTITLTLYSNGIICFTDPEISDFWAGIEKTYSEHWVWATGQRASKDDTADLENSDQSYARYTRGTGTDFKMEAISCDREIGVICRL